MLSGWADSLETPRADEMGRRGDILRTAAWFDFFRAHAPATEDLDDRLDLRFKILPRLEGVFDRGDLCGHRW